MKRAILILMFMLISFSSTTFAAETRNLPLGFSDINANLSVVNYLQANLPLTSVKTPVGYTQVDTSVLPKAPMIATVTFTPAGSSGQYGPTQAQIDSAYINTPLKSKVTLVNDSQQWVVPSTGVYTIDVYGAQGGTQHSTRAIGGKGAQMKGDFSLTKGQILNIRVGQSGGGTGGGGGSFVWLQGSTDPLIIAGGGGGGGGESTNNLYGHGNPGLATTNGGNGTGNYGTGGTNGSAGTAGGVNGSGGAGSGWLQDGPCSYNGALAQKMGGNGGASGGGTSGFGGGNGGWLGGGGGGGYSGGGGGNWASGLGGGGGGSFNAGASQVSTSGVNTGDGKVTITQIQ